MITTEKLRYNFYQSSMAQQSFSWWWSFGLKIILLAQATFLVSIQQASLPMISKANKLPMEMEQVAHDNNTSGMLKSGCQTFAVLYSTVIIIVLNKIATQA